MIRESAREHCTMRTFALPLTMVFGILVGAAGYAAMQPPSEHAGLDIEELGVVPGQSVSAQVGLDGAKLLLRRITIEPGGQIAMHSHESVPGLVHVETGTWTEGREGVEVEYSAGDTIVEDKETVHWFFNRGDEPASALVCDIKPM